MRRLFVTLVIVGLFVACGDDKRGPGEECTPTQEGAAECESGICLTGIRCQNGNTIDTACAGPDCSSSFKCSESMQCVPVTGIAMAYCLPKTLCESVESDTGTDAGSDAGP